jgi:hypothetical protein
VIIPVGPLVLAHNLTRIGAISASFVILLRYPTRAVCCQMGRCLRQFQWLSTISQVRARCYWSVGATIP